jgi:DNA-binding MarR family transcriptional regulator
MFQNKYRSAENKVREDDAERTTINMLNNDYLELWVNLVHTKDAISKVRRKELRAYNVSPEQSGILSLLTRSQEPPTPAEISRTTFRDPSSVSIILNRMEASGLIEKISDSNKKNLVRVSITKKGRKVYGKILETICIFRIMSGLSDEQCKQLNDCLKILQFRAHAELGDIQDATGSEDEKEHTGDLSSQNPDDLL